MVDYSIYGKIIVDTIRLESGELIRTVLGGGGPQGAFGARVWSTSVGLLSRSGQDLEPECRETLNSIDINLDGWVQFPDLHSPHGVMAYDENGYMLEKTQISISLEELTRDMRSILSRPIPIPASHQKAKVIHLITEYVDEPMVQSAMELKKGGAIFSLEPLIDFRKWENKTDITRLIKQADTATPDWPSASGIADSTDPLTVLKFWSKLGPPLICIRDGARGSYVWDANTDCCWHIPPVPVNVADPTGAGNSYGGGMCVGWAESKDSLTAGCYGAVSASFLVESVGMPKMSANLQTIAKKRLEQSLESAKSM